MMSTYTKFLAIVAFMIVGYASTLAAENYVAFTTQTNNGPVTNRKAQKVTYVMQGEALVLTYYTDTLTTTGPIFMKMTLRKYRGVGKYTLDNGTTWRYGKASDNIFTCQSGQAEVTRIDSNTNRIYGTFEWYGNAHLQSGVDLTLRIREGVFDVQIKPTIQLVCKPKDGVKVKPKETITWNVNTVKAITGQPVKGVTVSIKGPSDIFENIPATVTSNDAGVAAITLKVKDKVVPGPQTIKVTGTKENYDDSGEETIAFDVNSTDRYWYSKCNGLPFFEFDAGPDSTWKDGGEPFIETTGPRIKVNGFVSMDGLMRIDTTVNRVIGNGKFYIDNVSILGKDKFVIYDGPFSFDILNCGGILDLTSAALVEKISGGLIKNAKIAFLGDGINAAGAKISCTIDGAKNLSTGCNPDLKGAIWQANKEASLDLELQLMKSGDKVTYTASGTLKDASLGPSFCLQEFNLGYASENDSLYFNAKAKCPLFEEGTLGAYWRKGVLEGGKIGLKFNTCIPMPETPFCWKGFEASMDNMKTLNPFKIRLTGNFQVATKPDLCELDITAGAQFPPVQIDGGVTIKFMKFEAVSKDKPWQMEGAGSIMLDLDERSVTLKGGMKMFHLGDAYFLETDETRTLGFRNGVHFNASLKGSMKIPKLSASNEEKLGTFGTFVNKYAPINLGKIGGIIDINEDGPKTLTVNYDFNNSITALDPETDAALKSLGKGSATIDFEKLPSPTAFSLDASFTNLIKALVGGGGVAGMPTIATHEVIVPAGTEKLIFIANAKAGNITSALTSPSGKKYTETDKTDQVFRIVTPDSKMVLWNALNPATGTWKFESNSAAGDSVVGYVQAPQKTFTITAEKSDRSVQITWQPKTDHAVIIYVAPADDVNSTVEVARVQGNTGTYTLELNDTIAPCTFTVAAATLDPTVIGGVAHAEDVFTNVKSRLLPPQNIKIVANDIGHAKVTWDLSPSMDVAMYGVILSRTGMPDTTIASAFGSDKYIEFESSALNGGTIRMRAYDLDGYAGCLSEPVTIVVGVDDDVRKFEWNGMQVKLYPNPVTTTLSIQVQTLTDNVASIEIIDAMGRTEYVGSGNDLRIDSSEWPSGIHYVRITSGNQIQTVPIVLIH